MLGKLEPEHSENTSLTKRKPNATSTQQQNVIDTSTLKTLSSIMNVIIFEVSNHCQSG